VLNPDFRDMLSAFIEEGVEFLLVGAYAMAAHKMPRATRDIDLWVRPDVENSKRVMRALEKFGAPTFQVNEEDFQTPDMVYQFGVAPVRIDIITSIDAVEFAEAWQERMITELEGLNIPVISRKHLHQN
jgi:hypothetical protein